MKWLAKILVAWVAFQHLAFLVLEMFLWNTPVGHKTFNLTPDFAAQSAVLAGNQGLYNGFLAAGLVWSLVSKQDALGKQRFFLGCVVVAGIYGAATAATSIFFVQALPALIAIGAVWLSARGQPPRQP